jgi:TonB-linked SusC/RagA family outer membrane protein
MRIALSQNASRVVRFVVCGILGTLGLCVPGTASATATIVRMQAGPVITGRVVDARTNQGVARATVQLDDGRTGTMTGDDGRFRIANVSVGTHTVAIRRLGYAVARQSVTVTADRGANVDFTIQPAAASLEEVIVTGTAGGEQRRAIGNAVTTINATDELSKSAAPNFTSLIGARAPGVNIAQSTGRIGASPQIQIRGRNSIGLSNTPLIYIDGVRVNNAVGAGPVAPSGRLGGQGSNAGGRLNDINPEDIQSIEIIKGPAAATIYGTEAANGVIQIITKKGLAGNKPVVNMQVQDGTIWFRDAAARIPTNYAKDPAGNIVTWNGVQSEADRGTPLFRTGQTRAYTGSVSGGRDVMNYYASGTYENDLGIEPNNSLRQFGFHTNLTVVPSPTIDFATSLNFVTVSSHLGADFGASAMLGAIAGHSLLFPNARGFFPNFPPEVPQTLYDNAQGINRFTGSTTINHRPTSWFTQRLIVGIDQTSDDSRAIEHFASPALTAFVGPVTGAGSIGQTLRRTTVISADYSGTVKYALTQALGTTTSIGGQLYRTDLSSNFAGGTQFPAPGVENVSAVALPATPGGADTLNTTIGAYAQEQFSWRDRLYLTGAIRIDNNSAFGSDFKWVTYPKISASWVVNEEPFWRQNSIVTALKLRGAYGESGRAPVAYSAIRTFAPAQGPGGTSGVTPASIGNPDLRPERGKELELGFEGSLFDRLSLDFTYFNKKTTDVIINQPVAASTGFSASKPTNLGRLDNHGIELQANLQAITRSNFTWEVTANVATNKDVIKDLGGIPQTAIPSAGQYNRLGGPIGGIYTRRVISAGQDPVTGLPINVLCDDGAGGGVACGSAPFVYIGTPTPATTGAVGNTFYLFKRLRLYALVDFRRGYRVQNNNEEIRCFGLAGAPLCRSNYYPLEYDPVYLAEHQGTASALGTIDQFYQDGGFAKLREVSATYSVPDQWLRGFSRASITLAARELHTWTNYAGLDPEVNAAVLPTGSANTANTADQGLTPPLSRFIATINLTF